MTGPVTDLLGRSALEWIPALTLLLLLAGQPWRAHMPSGSVAQLLGLISVVLSMTGLLFTGVGASPWFWYVLTACHLSWVGSAYCVADNHHYLFGYWCLAVGLSLRTGGAEGALLLGRSASLLIGLCFACAVAAKLLSRAYRDGSFFTWELVSDPRFLPLATFAGKLTPDLRQRHLDARFRVRRGLSRRASAPIPSELRGLAVGLTWWTVGIETVIALLFLWPAEGLDGVRVLSLVVFALTTFVFVSVPSFGQVLLLMLLTTTGDPALRTYILALALWLAVMSFIPLVAQRLTLVAQKMTAGSRPPLGAAGGSAITERRSAV
jgi:hypothetical protein